jgi:hypothetical protein
MRVRLRAMMSRISGPMGEGVPIDDEDDVWDSETSEDEKVRKGKGSRGR